MKSILIRAAELLEELAGDIEASNTVAGKWDDEDDYDRLVHAEHAELVDVAKKLREREESDIRYAQNMSEVFNSGDGTYRP